MTSDFVEDLTQACQKEGMLYFIALTKDGDTYEMRSTLDSLPTILVRKQGQQPISRMKDFQDAVRAYWEENDSVD